MTALRHGGKSAAAFRTISEVAEDLDVPQVKPGDLVLIEAMGGGFTWGSALIRW